MNKLSLQQQEMVRRMISILSLLTSDHIATQEQPISWVQVYMFQSLSLGLCGKEVDGIEISLLFNDSIEGFYRGINPHILLGCALNIVENDHTMLVNSSVNAIALVKFLLQVNGPSISADQFKFEIENRYV
jgi:hypothetical protein